MKYLIVEDVTMPEVDARFAVQCEREILFPGTGLFRSKPVKIKEYLVRYVTREQAEAVVANNGSIWRPA